MGILFVYLFILQNIKSFFLANKYDRNGSIDLAYTRYRQFGQKRGKKFIGHFMGVILYVYANAFVQN